MPESTEVQVISADNRVGSNVLETPSYTTKSFISTIIPIFLVSIVIALISSSFGRFSMPITSGDWAQHMLIVEADLHNAKLSPGEQPWDFAFLAGYPSWAHGVVAYSSVAFGVDPVRCMQIWTAIFLLAGCVILALRLTLRSKQQSSVLSIAITIVFLAGCAYTGFGLRGHVVRNYFFPQLAGTVLAMGGLAALQVVEWDITLASLMVVLWGGAVLPNFHLLPAVWFSLASLIMFCLTSVNWRVTAVQCALIGLTNLCLWRLESGFMVYASAINGWFLIRFAQLSDHGTGLAAGLGIVFLLLGLTGFNYLRLTPPGERRRTLVPLAGLIAVILLICLQAFAYLALHRGSVYSVEKYLYLLCAELAVVTMGIRWKAASYGKGWIHDNPGKATTGVFIALFLAQAPFFASPYDQKPLMEIRRGLIGLPASYLGQRNYPQFSFLDYDRNYYLAIAVLRIPHDARTLQWLSRGATGETPFEWPDSNSVPIPNADFETGLLTPWISYASVHPEITQDRAHAGKFALAEAGDDGSIYQDISGLAPGAEYMVTAFVSGESGGTATAQIGLWDPGARGPLLQAAPVTPGGAWQKVYQSFKAGQSGKIRVHLLKHSGRGTVYWDDARIVTMR